MIYAHNLSGYWRNRVISATYDGLDHSSILSTSRQQLKNSQCYTFVEITWISYLFSTIYVNDNYSWSHVSSMYLQDFSSRVKQTSLFMCIWWFWSSLSKSYLITSIIGLKTFYVLAFIYDLHSAKVINISKY